MYSLKIKDKELYVPKTPYNETEMKNGYITNIDKRIAKYKYFGVAENRLKLFQPMYTEVLEIVEII